MFPRPTVEGGGNISPPLLAPQEMKLTFKMFDIEDIKKAGKIEEVLIGPDPAKKDKCPEKYSRKSFRWWFITQYGDANMAWWFDHKEKKIDCKRGQIELCPSTNRKHLQACFHTVDKITWNKVREIIPRGCCVEPSDSVDGSIKYCDKEKTRFQLEYNGKVYRHLEYGNIPGKNEIKSSDLKLLWEYLKENNYDYKKTLCEHPELGSTYARNCRGIAETCQILRDKNKKIEIKKEIIILWGPAGVGKTEKFIREYGPENCSVFNDWKDYKFSSNYDGQKVLIMDEFNPQQQNPNWLWLNMLFDPLVKDIQIKMMPNRLFTSEIIVLTSNTDPRNWHKAMPYSFNQDSFWRRITKIIHVEAEGVGKIDHQSRLFNNEETLFINHATGRSRIENKRG